MGAMAPEPPDCGPGVGLATHRGGAGATLTHQGGNDRRKNPLFLRPLHPAPSHSSPLLPPTDCGHQAHLPIMIANPQAGENSWIRQFLKASRGLLTSCHPKSPQENPPAAQQPALVPSTWVSKPDSHFPPGCQAQPRLHISKPGSTPASGRLATLGAVKPQRGKRGGGCQPVKRIFKISPGMLMPSQS